MRGPGWGWGEESGMGGWGWAVRGPGGRSEAGGSRVFFFFYA